VSRTHSTALKVSQYGCMQLQRPAYVYIKNVCFCRAAAPAWRVLITLAEKDLQYVKQCDFSKSKAGEVKLCEGVVLLATFHLCMTYVRRSCNKCPARQRSTRAWTSLLSTLADRCPR
jgi:hypothetical protein